MLIVSDALTGSDGALRLHLELSTWERVLSRRPMRWFACDDRTPLGWRAALCGVAPAAFRAVHFPHIPDNARQLWVASPYAAEVGRDAVHVLPDALFPWSENDAVWLCEALNPLLAEEGMRLIREGKDMLLCCRKPLDVAPLDFARISGGLLPDRHPPGRDGGRLMRLLSEIQMLLHANSRASRPETARDAPVAGLWLWGGCLWPPGDARREARGEKVEMLPSAAMPEIVNVVEAVRRWPDAPPASDMLLVGGGHAVWLRRGWLPRWRREWRPVHARDEAALMDALRAVCDAA